MSVLYPDVAILRAMNPSNSGHSLEVVSSRAHLPIPKCSILLTYMRDAGLVKMTDKNNYQITAEGEAWRLAQRH